jgi:hypothetical protein
MTMRRIRKSEAEAWMALARQYGFADDEGHIALGRYMLEEDESGTLCVRFITPVPAGLHSDTTLAEKTPPILFDRDDAGRIVLPGRWWQRTFEKLSEHEGVPPDVRRTALIASRSVVFEDCHLPSDFETIEFMASDDDGTLVLHEALPPETRISLAMRPK